MNVIPPGVRAETTCVACRYDLRGLPQRSTCPECGKTDPHLHPVEGVTSFDFLPDRAAYLLAVTVAETAGLFPFALLHTTLLRAAMIRQGHTPFAVDRWLEGDSAVLHIRQWPPPSPLALAAVLLAAAAPFAALSRRRWWIGAALLTLAAALTLLDTQRQP
jgi:hypothetical protein